MTNLKPEPLNASLGRILRPLARLLLRKGIGLSDFISVMRTTYVEVADTEEFILPGRKKQSVARIAVITGINRKEVKKQLDLITEKRLQNPGLLNGDYLAFNHNVIATVINSWITDTKYTDNNGKPRVLTFGEDEKGGFEDLVKKHTSDMTPRSILDEMVRLDTVEKNKSGKIKLTCNGYLPEDRNRMMGIGSENISDLMKTVIHNIDSNEDGRLFQRRAYYDNIPKECVDEFRPYGKEKAETFIEDINLALSSRDRDNNPGVTGEGRYRAGFGVFYFEEKILD